MDWVQCTVGRLKAEERIAEYEMLLEEIEELSKHNPSDEKRIKHIENQLNTRIALAKEKVILYRKLEEECDEGITYR